MLDLSRGAQGEGGLSIWWVCGPQIAEVKRSQRSKGILSLIYRKSRWSWCSHLDVLKGLLSNPQNIHTHPHTCSYSYSHEELHRSFFTKMALTLSHTLYTLKIKNRHKHTHRTNTWQHEIQTHLIKNCIKTTTHIHTHRHCSAASCSDSAMVYHIGGQVENSGHASLSSPLCVLLPAFLPPSLFPPFSPTFQPPFFFSFFFPSRMHPSHQFAGLLGDKFIKHKRDRERQGDRKRDGRKGKGRVSRPCVAS